jgi:polysaccharide pyruvyl transferase WcaK-like protein
MHINDHLSIQWKRVLIVGNWSHKNMWDELIVLGTIKLLLKQGKKIYVAAHDPLWLKWFFKQPQLLWADVSKIHFIHEAPKWLRSLLIFWLTGKFRHLVRYFQVDSIIIGGGEILTEENKSSYRYRLAGIFPCLLKKLFKHIDIYLMWGIQVPTKKRNRILFSYLLKRTSKIYARDEETVHELKEYGFPDVEFFMDTSYFALDRNKIKYEEWRIKKLIPNQYIVVNLNKNGEHFLNDMVQDIKEYLVKWYRVLFVPVSKWFNGEYMDIKYYYKLKNALVEFDTLPLVHFSLLDREYDFQGFVNMLAGAEIVISSRLHLFLISEFLGVKTKVYPYQRKILKMQKVVEKLGA